jgi:hypothetical protein
VSEVMKVQFTANPTQRKFIESRAEADLFDCRKGEGKSAGLCWACFYHTKHNPGATSLFIRDTWENLRRTTLQEFLRWFPDGIFGEWRKGDKEYIWNTEKTGLKGKVIFMGVESDEDASKIASMPLAAVYIDEPSGAAGESSGVSEFVFDTAFAQLRQPGMKWYSAKLAQNNPDESHWTYRRFWDPGTPATGKEELLPQQVPGFVAWQTKSPENVENLPPGYYDRMERTWAHRPDLLRRFVEGKHGYQQVGKPVTPEWSDDLHLARKMEPVKDVPLILLWDGGLNPTCIITQITPLGDWLILESFVGDEIGMYELIGDVIKPRLAMGYVGYERSHIGDPALKNREQSSSIQSAAKVIKKELGGVFRKGVVGLERIDPLRAALRKVRQGRGIIRVDKDKAHHVWWALRGGWHRHVNRSGAAGDIVKDKHSHPGDCMSYGASLLFPLGNLRGPQKVHVPKTVPGYYNTAPGTSLGMARPGLKMPKHGDKIGG